MNYIVNERNRMSARCLKATAKDSLPIGKLFFEKAQYSLPSALADGQKIERIASASCLGLAMTNLDWRAVIANAVKQSQTKNRNE